MNNKNLNFEPLIDILGYCEDSFIRLSEQIEYIADSVPDLIYLDSYKHDDKLIEALSVLNLLKKALRQIK